MEPEVSLPMGDHYVTTQITICSSPRSQDANGIYEGISKRFRTES